MNILQRFLIFSLICCLYFVDLFNLKNKVLNLGIIYDRFSNLLPIFATWQN